MHRLGKSRIFQKLKWVPISNFNILSVGGGDVLHAGRLFFSHSEKYHISTLTFIFKIHFGFKCANSIIFYLVYLRSLLWGHFSEIQRGTQVATLEGKDNLTRVKKPLQGIMIIFYLKIRLSLMFENWETDFLQISQFFSESWVTYLLKENLIFFNN